MRKEKLDSCSDGGLPRMQVLHTCICPEYRFYIPAGCFEDLKERRKFYFLVLLGVFLRTATAIIVFTVFFYKKIEELKSWKTGVFFGKNRDSCSLLFEGNVCVFVLHLVVNLKMNICIYLFQKNIAAFLI